MVIRNKTVIKSVTDQGLEGCVFGGWGRGILE